MAKATELPTGSWQGRAGMRLSAASHTPSFSPGPGALKQSVWLLLPVPQDAQEEGREQLALSGTGAQDFCRKGSVV